jgi:NAD(P)-dependent dehydrogenase (short-subunit alcohol dehydrogenase family)
MGEPRSIVITGASRGLGLASAVHFYKLGWRVIAAMRSVDSGLQTLRATTGAAPDDLRLLGVQLDLDDAASTVAAARQIEQLVGSPDVLVHNAGIAAVGCSEEMPVEIWERVFRTNVFGPVRLTTALLPAMRAAGRGRIVTVSSQGGIRGMPSIGAYSASKGALERWAEALAQEVAPFGLGVTVVVTGTFKTDIVTEKTPDFGNRHGPYAAQYASMIRLGDVMLRKANSPEYFAQMLAKIVEESAPFARQTVGTDATMLATIARLLPSKLLHRVIRKAMGLPREGALKHSQALLPQATMVDHSASGKVG